MGAENRIYMRVMQLNVTKTSHNEISNGAGGGGDASPDSAFDHCNTIKNYNK